MEAFSIYISLLFFPPCVHSFPISGTIELPVTGINRIKRNSTMDPHGNEFEYFAATDP